MFSVMLYLSDQHGEVLEHFFHSLDIWHKSVKLTAKLSAVSTTKQLVVTCTYVYFAVE